MERINEKDGSAGFSRPSSRRIQGHRQRRNACRSEKTDRVEVDGALFIFCGRGSERPAEITGCARERRQELTQKAEEASFRGDRAESESAAAASLDGDGSERRAKTVCPKGSHAAAVLRLQRCNVDDL